MPKRKAWYFDADAYNAWLASEVIERNRLLVDRFRALTQAIVRDAVGVGRDYLEVIALDDEDFADDQWVHINKWYAACMARQVMAGPSDDHIMLLKPTLELAGWSEDDINSVITGDQLATLARSPNTQAFANELAPHLEDHRYGGWLAPDRARELASRLENARGLFEHPTKRVLELYPPDLSGAGQLLIQSVQEAITVLEGGVNRQIAIRIVTRF
jgi:hypothetical protein